MYQIEKVSDYLRVTGYPDGSDWLFRPEPPPSEYSLGVAGPEHVWCGYPDSGRLQLYHAPTRRPSATVELGALRKHAPPIPVTVSRDGRRLFVVHSLETESALNVVEIATGEITAVHRGLPWYLPRRPVERLDGRLLLEAPRHGLILLDPATGERQDSQVSLGDPAPRFLSASPDGRYWLRFDPTTFPTHDTAPSLVERLSGKGSAERQYGLTVQLWEAFPLRFLRRVVVAWLKVEELPDEAHLRTPTGRRAIWDAAAAAAAANAGPTDPPPARSAYPAPFSTDDAAWKRVEANVASLAGNWIRVAGWQPNEAAFWVSTNSFLSCVGVDGTVSPRLYTQRLGLEGGTWLPVAARWKDVIPQDGRKARVIYPKGEALFDGAPSREPHRTVAIPTDRDHWRAGNNDWLGPDQKEVFRRISALEDERRTIVVPLAAWTEADCVAAIDALTARVGAREVHNRVRDGNSVRIVFTSPDGERIGESRFFSEVGARFPGTAPAIRGLVERYADVSGPDRTFHFNAEDDTGIFSHAVRALGVLDRSALPTLERYGLLVDAEHEYYFAGTTVPDVIEAHGWTDDVVDFVFWVLVRNYYNTLQDYGVVWREWGLRDAVVRREPRAFARHLTSALADLIARDDDPGRYGPWGFEQLAKQIPQPHEPWAQAFFAELERIAAERAGPRT
jgi:hypothetical protein